MRRRGYAGHFSWTGFYLGGHIGGAWAHRDVTDTFCPGAGGRETGRAPASMRIGRMPIIRLLENSKLTPDDVEILTRAFKEALRALSLVDRNDPLTEIVARKIIEIGPSPVRDPIQIAELAIKQLGVPRGRDIAHRGRTRCCTAMVRASASGVCSASAVTSRIMRCKLWREKRDPLETTATSAGRAGLIVRV